MDESDAFRNSVDGRTAANLQKRGKAATRSAAVEDPDPVTPGRRAQCLVLPDAAIPVSGSPIGPA